MLTWSLVLSIFTLARAAMNYDSEGNYKEFFRIENETSITRQWTLKVNTERFGTDFVTFFASDIDRPLSYSCAFSTALCDFSVTKGPHDPGSQRTLVYANMKQPIHLPVPTMSGYLMICTGWVNMFWKRPLIVEYRIRLYRDRVPVPSRTNGTYFCQLISPESAEVSKELEIPPPSRNRRCAMPTFSCSSFSPVHPDPQAIDVPVLDVHIWYMTRQNYHDMQMGVLTNVFIPVFSNEYTVNLYGTVDNLTNTTCHVLTPFASKMKTSISNTILNRVKYGIRARPGNSGVYSVICSRTYYDSIAGVSRQKILKKSLKINFIKGPKITLAGQEDYIKYFPSNSSSANILVLVYTTSPLVSFEVNGGVTDSIVSSFVSNSPYEIIWKHSILLPRLDYDMNGAYEIRVVNEDEEQATQAFTILKAEFLKMAVNPVQLAVGVSSRVRFECAGFGNFIESITWGRDIGKDKNVISQTYHTSRVRGLRMVMEEVALEDSGVYQCTVSNRYQSLTKQVELIVWPVGGPYLSLNATSPHSPLPTQQSGPTVLDITDKQIEEEMKKYTDYGSQAITKITLALEIISAVAFVALLASGVIFFVRKYGKKINRGKRGREGEEEEEEEETEEEEGEMEEEEGDGKEEGEMKEEKDEWEWATEEFAQDEWEKKPLQRHTEDRERRKQKTKVRVPLAADKDRKRDHHRHEKIKKEDSKTRDIKTKKGDGKTRRKDDKGDEKTRGEKKKRVIKAIDHKIKKEMAVLQKLLKIATGDRKS